MVIDASAGVDVVGAVDGWAERVNGWIEQDVMLIAPPQFRLEMANAMLLGQRHALPVVRARMRALAELEIEISQVPSDEILECLGLAARHGLTVYDAAYLQLALHLEAELATRDKALARAARAEGLVVHE